MKVKVLCPVCGISFLAEDSVKKGDNIICTVCGAKLEVTEKSPATLLVKKSPQSPEDEINERIECFAKLRCFDFNEDKDLVLEGLIQKKDKFGDFYCPCRIENIPENICPCQETIKGYVTKNGNCY